MCSAVPVQTVTKLSGKLNTTSRLTASEMAKGKACRLFFKDKKTAINYLIDTGAEVSISSKRMQPENKATQYYLYAANGAKISTYGTKLMQVNLGLRRQLLWEFLAAKVNHPIIGADFLNNFGLVVDLKNSRICNGITGLQIMGSKKVMHCVKLSTIDVTSPAHNILRDYKEITQPATSNKAAARVTLVEHQIVTKGQPVYAKPRRLNSEKFEIARKEFEFMTK
ncbi:uncharacterized protein LOC119681579 [Teleopsis dalmanni]|uniref:uncharacterized protein LOC119681579 n=1 Tax=Teleopsis dalmanni TaxID=139649 RepID=UPI0018CE9AA4|nr:uncharacterized protein LOC119681579 [Teleopsis dalmanni]